MNRAEEVISTDIQPPVGVSSAVAAEEEEEDEYSAESNKHELAIAELNTTLSVLEKTKATLQSIDPSLTKLIAVKINCLKEELEVLIADLEFTLLNENRNIGLLSENSSADVFTANAEHYETDDDIEDPDAPIWKARSNRDNSPDFDDTDDEDTDEEELRVSGESKPKVLANKAKVSLVPSTQQIKFAPPRVPPLQGTINLVGVAIKWNTGTSASVSSVRTMCNQIAAASKVLTNGRLQVNTVAKVARVNLPKSAKNLGAAEKAAKRMLPGYDRYALVNHGAGNVSRAGGDNLSLLNTLATTAKHEFYHFVKKGYGLGHAGRYVKDGKGYRFESSRDGFSFMSIYPAQYVCGPQLYWIGMPEKKVAQYDIGSPTIVYNMQLLYSKDKEGFVKGVLIPNPTGGRNMFLSIDVRNGTNSMLLHYFAGGGSQRLAVFNKQTEFYGLNGEINPGIQIERLEYSGDLSKVRVGTKFKSN